MITAKTAILATNQSLEDHFDKCILNACKERKSKTYLSKESMPSWLIEKVSNQGFVIENIGESYKVSWGVDG